VRAVTHYLDEKSNTYEHGIIPWSEPGRIGLEEVLSAEAGARAPGRAMLAPD
jgi:hypothetical protein